MEFLIEIGSLNALLEHAPDLAGKVVQSVDLSSLPGTAPRDWNIEDSVFLGCIFRDNEQRMEFLYHGAVVFPRLPELPYDPYRASLYTVDELMAGYEEGNDQSLDKRIYDHFSAHRRHHAPIMECLAQRIHDHAVDDALEEFLHADGVNKKPVGIMGGHGTPRSDPYYRKVAEIARELTRDGYLVVSGGGPGIMEAANLGAWMAAHEDRSLDDAIGLMSRAPGYADPGFIELSRQVVDRWPKGAKSLAIPTWFYGHEPSNLFSTHIAKYFSNSIREDGLLAIAIHGVIYAPGSAGTLQEVFVDLCQNHYGTFTYISPMVFLGEDHYRETAPVWPMLEKFAAGRAYAEYLHLSDEAGAAAEFIRSHPPVEPA